MSRQIVMDTETTGLEYAEGHRIIELGAVELVDRRLTGNNYHQYVRPEREIDAGALEVHGISNEFLEDKPLFEEIAADFLDYLTGADELIIHNAPFDIGFLDNELRLAGLSKCIGDLCAVTDSLVVARKKFPGKRNSLDALCDRMEINNAHRTLHGALLDSEILADVYLLLTGGQENMAFEEPEPQSAEIAAGQMTSRGALPVVRATEAEIQEHERWCDDHKVPVW